VSGEPPPGLWSATDDATGHDPTEPSPGPGPTSRPNRFLTRLCLWRSPGDQPRWARPALLAIAAGAGLSYGWGMGNFPLEPFYGAAVRSMGMSWRNFFFGAVDPAGTVTLDKLPGAFWLQALSVRVFGFHYWSVALPQVIAGVLTVLVLYRVVRRLAGPKAGLVAALILATSPVSALVNRGNVSDSVLVLLTVLAADATTRALETGRLRTLLLAGLWVGLAFQTKMVQAWLIVPALLAAYAVAAPPNLRRRLGHVAMAGVVAVIVSLSWMTVVAAVPGHDRPYVDGTTDDSIFTQVFVYNGWLRIGVHLDADKSVHGLQPFLAAAVRENTQVGTYRIGASPQRLLVGPLGRDDAWLLPAALVSAVAVLVARRSRWRRDPMRAAVILWAGWLVVLAGFFSFGAYVNSYYTAALVPAVAALCAMGLALAWRTRATSRNSRGVLLVVVPVTALYAVSLLPPGAGVRVWVTALTAAVAVVAEVALAMSMRGGVSRHGGVARRGSGGVAIALAALSLLLVPAITTGVVVNDGLGSFSTPYQSAAATFGTTTNPEQFQEDGERVRAGYARAYPGSQIVYATDSSAVAAPLIMITGREFLPIGGYSGDDPAPTIATLRHLVDTGMVQRFLIPVSPRGRDPRMAWVRAHCSVLYTEPYGVGVEVGLYHCYRT
jgi:4-amino-4-deoxy-L-arabinose transferase-like glycosyltransferase